MRMTMLCCALALAGCSTRPVYVDRVVEVKVPVHSPCMGTRPTDVTPLREQYSREEWDSLSTDQRANLIAAQALGRKLFGEQLADAAIGCQ
jgi:hypothetical protein